VLETLAKSADTLLSYAAIGVLRAMVYYQVSTSYEPLSYQCIAALSY
jgi:hypothetical protein